MHPKDISILDHTYTLPDQRIALYPLAERDSSKLLIYRNGSIQDDIYKNITRHLPGNSLLVFNNTKVIRARILFQKPTGAVIEIFCLEPAETIPEYSTFMNKQGSVRWTCLIGGAGKWKEGELVKKFFINKEEVIIKARLAGKQTDTYVVELSWTPEAYSFAEVIERAGNIPLPHYIKRETDASDNERYQTIYARDEGSVAAPTAGLHFTEEIFNSFPSKHIETNFVTLHVGAGTFKPVKSATMAGHEMHAEWIDVDLSVIEQLANGHHDTCFAVGTTSVRTLESLYWMGVKLILDPSCATLQVNQWEVYEEPLHCMIVSPREALNALSGWLKKRNLPRLFTQTRFMIAPGYRFRMIQGLITNFHQPQSTLLLLVAAAVGDDWKNIYEHALQHNYRFLSYGDGCLLYVKE